MNFSIAILSSLALSCLAIPTAHVEEIDVAKQVQTNLTTAQSGHAIFTNFAGQTIHYVFTGEYGRFLGRGIVEHGQTAHFPYGHSHCIKIGHSPYQTSSNIYQFEFNADPSLGRVTYDLSALNGNPFVKHRRVVIPSDGSCPRELCAPGAKTADCQYIRHPPGEQHTPKTCSQAANLHFIVG